MGRNGLVNPQTPASPSPFTPQHSQTAIILYSPPNGIGGEQNEEKIQNNKKNKKMLDIPHNVRYNIYVN